MKAKYLILLLMITSLLACDDMKRPAMKPSPAGAPGDLLLVVSDNIWESAAGDTLRAILAQPVEALPQDEPMFNVIRIRKSVFGKTFNTQRNIVMAEINPDLPESRFITDRSLWAETQIVIGLQAKSQEELISLLETRRHELVSLILDAERKRLMADYKKLADPEISRKLREKYRISLAVPRGFDLDVEKDDFIWISQEYRDIVQGILIYTFPYTHPETFTRDFLVHKRDSILKANVPGEVQGSYMQTEPLFPPLFNSYQLRNEKYTAELRGLWRMEKGLAMGGPFISVTQLDEERNRIVTLDAFVFAPAHKKRDLLRQLEAIILTIGFVPDKEQAEAPAATPEKRKPLKTRKKRGDR